MALDSVTKQPYEVFWVSSSFAEDLNTDEGIASLVVTAVDKNGADATAGVTIISGAVSSGQICYVQVQAGTEALTPYKITFRIVSTADPVNKWENDILLKIKEL